MKRLFAIMLILALTLSFSFADTKVVHVYFDVLANEITDLQGDYFVDEQKELLLMEVNTDSIQDGFIVDYEKKSNILTFKPPDLFDGQTTFEYYFLDEDFGSYNVFAHVNVEYLEVDVVNQRIKEEAEKLILSDIKEEYKVIYKQIIELIMQIEPE